MTKLRTTTTALLSLASPVWCFTAEKVDSAAAAACSATDGDACVEEADAHALLSLRASHVQQRRASTCPGSNKACSGNQCCDGILATRNRTFPCPDADPDYHKCAVDWDICPGGVVEGTPVVRCVGNQCCPGVGITFPCPGADPNWDECDTFVSEIAEIDNVTYSEQKAPHLIVFWAPWCHWSRRFVTDGGSEAPIEQVSRELQASGGPAVLKYNVGGRGAPRVPRPPGFDHPYIPSVWLVTADGTQVLYDADPADIQRLVTFALGDLRASDGAAPAAHEGCAEEDEAEEPQFVSLRTA